MSEFLLPTKLFIPPQRPHLTPRPRLIERLNEEAGRKLTLVAAPAGFGKTTLITSWLGSENGHPAAWLSLDENDNLFTRFFTYFIAAIQTVYPDLAKGLMSSLQSSQVPGEEAVVSALLYELAALNQPLRLVLDDYHVIDNQMIHEALESLIDYMPPSLHLVITSRESPPLSLPRWRVRSQLTEIGAADLRFTVTEAAVFLRQTMGLELEETAVAALEDRTEGWVAGLQLAALSLRGSENSGRFIADFDGSNRHVADYLLEEVLHRQKPEIQTFLQQTAILERFCGPLCDVITGAGRRVEPASSSTAMLEQIENSNLFLIPLDAHRRWYRYHHLFAGLLRDRLQRQQGMDRVNDLHRRASEWFAEEGLLDEAVHHAILGQDYEEAARLVASIPSDDLWDMGSIGLLKKWGHQIPDDAYLKYPRAAMIVAAVELITGDFRYFHHYLELIEDVKAVRGEYALFQSIMVRNQGDSLQALHLAREAGEFLDENDFATRAVALMQMAVNMFQIGELVEADRALAKALSILRNDQLPNANLVLQVLQMQAMLRTEQIDFKGAAQIIEEGIRMAEAADNGPPPMIGVMLAWLGSIYYEWNLLEEAAGYYAQSRSWADRTGISDIIIPTLLGEIDLLCQKRDKAAVRPKLNDLRAMITNSQLKEAVLQMEGVIARYHLRLGQVEEAVAWINESGIELNEQLLFKSRFHYMALAAIRLAESGITGKKEQISDIVGMLDRLIQAARRGNYRHTMSELLILKAMAQDLNGDRTAAVQTLQEAVDMAESGPLVRLFINFGQPMGSLLAECDGEYARALYEALQADLMTRGLETAEPEPAALPLDLTPREFDVLQAIVAGLSNKEIEEELVISHNTVRTHIKNLYSKLDVSSRTQAVKKALDLGISS